ncbi:MAG: penicillin-binding protein, partial [Eggerthellaceae bacterium]|nr:penicillin-binding protein [Eggerthellaceae bacterium]
MASRAMKNRTSVRKKRGIAGVLSVLAIIAIVIASGAFVISSFVNTWFEDLPDYHSADAFNTSLPTVVYANDGTTEIARLQLEYRVPVELSEVNQNVIDATIAVEDARFYEHSGVDVAGIIRALINNLLGGRIEGASTITQQFVRNTILADEMDEISIKRKAREAAIAMELEKMYSKEEILQMYLNTINYGAGAYGVEAASQRYFSKHASELTLTEAALIAGVPQSPTYNDPIAYPDRALARRNAVLDRMQVNNYISFDECVEAQSQPLGLNPSTTDDDGIIAYPYFASYVRYLLYNDFDLSEADILKGGLKVYTTLDIGKQQVAEWAAAVKRESLNDSMEVAIAVVNPENGYVEAIVGGSDYAASQVNLATGQGGYGRPCGSVFKTFTLVTAIKKGINPNTTYLDCTSPATVDGYTLENYANTN